MTTIGAGEAPIVLAMDEVDGAAGLPWLRRVLDRLAAKGREPGQGEAGVTITEAPATITAGQRSSILNYASDLLPVRERTPGAVLAVAGPLLEEAAAYYDFLTETA